MRSYTQKRGDIVHLDFSPQAGHEMRGPAPKALVDTVVHNIMQVIG